MKLYKLLFFLFALVGLNSCVEYVDNGVKPEGGETPEQKKFTAEHSNPTEAKYVGDTFEFKAMMNSVDVTSSTKFKVNGSDIKENTYVPHKTGDHSVIATLDDTYTATFKFKVLEKDEEPEEPTGNRIEYGGKSYPVSETLWLININSKNEVLLYDINGTICSMWAMISMELDNADKILHQFTTAVYVPIKANDDIAFPNESPAVLQHINGGNIVINGKEVFQTTNVAYNFATTGNTAPSNPLQITPPWTGTANFTGVATGASSGNSAKLFWEGDYTAVPQKITAKTAFANIPTNFKALTKEEYKNLKVVK